MNDNTTMIETICVHGIKESKEFANYGSVAMPIYQTATFAHPGVAESTGYDYSRLQNPTREKVEQVVANLEQGIDAVAFASGMAALAACMEIFLPGDHIIAGSDLYGGTGRLFNHINTKNGITVSYVDTANLQEIEAAVQCNTKAVFLETPTNPMMHVTDIAAVGRIAKKYGILLIVDNTFLSPYFQKPITLGADIVLHSGTKFLGGHNDTLAGFLVLANQELSDKIRFIIKTTGAGLAPLDSFLILRGIKTLALRMEKQQENAYQIAKWLKKQSKIKEIYFIGDESHPGYHIHKNQASGVGGMLSFRTDCEATAKGILNRVKLIQYAESLGGVESLITYPMLQTHADVPQKEKDRIGINETLLRLSVGIEHIDDLIKDLKQAMQ